MNYPKLNAIAFVLLFLPADRTFADCKIWNPADVSTRLFAEAITQSATKKPEDPAWVQALPMFAKNKVSVNAVQTSGIGSIRQGFIVNVDGKDSYFMKRTDCSEARELFQVSHSALAQPACILARAHEPQLARFALKTEKDVPRLALTLAVHEVKKDECDVLMEFAGGIQGYKIPYSDAHSLENVGRQIALLHALGLVHRDLNRWNFYYAPKTHVMTLLDYAELGKVRSEEEILTDLEDFRFEPKSDEPHAEPFFASHELLQLLEGWFPEKGEARFTAKDFVAHIQAQHLSSDFGLLERFENFHLSIIEMLKGYLQMLPQTEQHSFAKKLAVFQPQRPALSFAADYRIISDFLRQRIKLNDSEVQAFWKRFPSLERLANGNV